MTGFIQIDFQWASDGFWLKTNFGLDRNEIFLCGYKFGNDSENFGLIRNKFQSETFARVMPSERLRLRMGLYNQDIKSTLAKVADWNSLRTNLKFSESFRNLYLHQTVSFRSNPKLVFNANQSEDPFKINPNL